MLGTVFYFRRPPQNNVERDIHPRSLETPSQQQQQQPSPTPATGTANSDQ